jgi:hypothetical protein
MSSQQLASDELASWEITSSQNSGTDIQSSACVFFFLFWRKKNKRKTTGEFAMSFFLFLFVTNFG